MRRLLLISLLLLSFNSARSQFDLRLNFGGAILGYFSLHGEFKSSQELSFEIEATHSEEVIPIGTGVALGVRINFVDLYRKKFTMKYVSPYLRIGSEGAGAGLIFGRKVVFPKRFVLDIFLGGGFYTGGFDARLGVAVGYQFGKRPALEEKSK